MLKIINSAEASKLIARKAVRLTEAERIVEPILHAVATRGDAALFEYAEAFDGFERESFLVEKTELECAEQTLSSDLRSAMQTAISNIGDFARLQMPLEFMHELAPGHFVGQVVRPLERIAAYIPGGRFPLPSTVLMSCVPAKVAGVGDVWVTTPKENQAIFGAARLAGADNVALIGGAHAVAAFAYGTETIPKADRIVGPGNIYVTAAKKMLAGSTGIDFVAGPTEVLILANEGRADWIAADMLAQAEHDPDAAAIFLTTSAELGAAVAKEVERQLKGLPTAPTAKAAIKANSAVVVCTSVQEQIDLANEIAAEHVCLHDPSIAGQIVNAGSLFLGECSVEAAGDYVTGPNHVLPTAGAARLRGGLSVLDFVKVISVQQISPDALARVAAAGTALARAEGLEAHARSIEVRLNA